MEIPKRIKKYNRHYEYVKEYENLVLYKDIESNLLTCFQKNDFIRKEAEKVKHPRFNFKKSKKKSRR